MIPPDPRHLGVLSGVSKLTSKHMVCFWKTKTFVLNTHVTINIESCSDASYRRTDQFIRVQVQWRPASGRTVILEPI